jgi:hypothetical protein
MNRKLVEIDHGFPNWPRVFMLHANAAKGKKCTTICAIWLENMVKGDWLMAGDFNDEPADVMAWLDWFGSDPAVWEPDDWTHHSSKISRTSGFQLLSEKRLDYVVSSDTFQSITVGSCGGTNRITARSWSPGPSSLRHGGPWAIPGHRRLHHDT